MIPTAPELKLAGSDSLRSLADDLVDAIRESAGPQPLLLDPRATRVFLGLSKSGFYRLVSQDDFPKAIQVSGNGPRWRRADLERWVSQLKGRRRTPTLVGAN